MHGAALYAVLAYSAVGPAVVPPEPLMVRFIAQSEPQAPQPVVQPTPRPKVEPQRRVHKPAVAPRVEEARALAAVTTEPAASVAVPADPVPPAPMVLSAPPAPSTVATAAPAATSPSFDADYLRNPAPRYPPLARRMGQQGKVVLRVLVNAGGDPAKVEVRASSGSDVLDEAALDAVKRWRFVPARKGEQAVDAWVLVPITFSLQG